MQKRWRLEGERCELCAAPIGREHRHVVDLERRVLCCSCRACAILFDRPEAGGKRYRAVPERVLVDDEGSITQEVLDELSVPVALAFIFFNSSQARWVAFYPSPAGATESELPIGGLEALRSSSALVRAIEPDVEALLLRGRRGGGVVDALLVPIDVCYDLVARIRADWKGFDGGDEVRAELDSFFTKLRERSAPAREVSR